MQNNDDNPSKQTETYQRHLRQNMSTNEDLETQMRPFGDGEWSAEALPLTGVITQQRYKWWRFSACLPL